MGKQVEYEGRCSRCKKQVSIINGKEVRMKNGLRTWKGDCEKCGDSVFRLLGKR